MSNIVNTGVALDDQLRVAGMLTVSERMKCEGVMDHFGRHGGVNTLSDFLTWVEMERRSVMEMQARHDLGVHVLSEDIADFVLGKSAILWEVHVNLLHVLSVMKEVQNG